MKTHLRLASLSLFAFSLSCSDATAPKQINELNAARERWHAQNLHTYAYTLQRSCFCGTTHPLYVVVVNDAVVGALDVDTGESLPAAAGETVDGLFAFIQNAVDRRAQLIRASYDGVKGFPSEIDYDGAANIADDEISYRASDVHPIVPPT